MYVVKDTLLSWLDMRYSGDQDVWNDNVMLLDESEGLTTLIITNHYPQRGKF